MKKSNLLVLGLIGFLMVAGLVLAGCGNLCPGNGNCTVTISQGSSGLYVDYGSPRSSCGKSATYSNGSYSGGCSVQNQMDNRNRRFGTHSCNC